MGDVVEIGKSPPTTRGPSIQAVVDGNARVAQLARTYDIGSAIVLPLIEYERCRLSVAKKVGVRASVLDRLRRDAQRLIEGYRPRLVPISPPKPTRYTDPNGAEDMWLAIADREKDADGAFDGTVLAISFDGEVRFKIMQWVTSL